MSKRIVMVCTVAVLLGVGFLALADLLIEPTLGVDVTTLRGRSLWALFALMLAPLLAGACFSAAATIVVVCRRRTARGHDLEASELGDEDRLGTSPPEVLEL